MSPLSGDNTVMLYGRSQRGTRSFCHIPCKVNGGWAAYNWSMIGVGCCGGNFEHWFSVKWGWGEGVRAEKGPRIKFKRFSHLQLN